MAEITDETQLVDIVKHCVTITALNERLVNVDSNLFSDSLRKQINTSLNSELTALHSILATWYNNNECVV
jgi:hypothetical protein